MLYIFAAILISLWLLGLISDLLAGGLIHLLLLAAIIMIVVQMIRGGKKDGKI
jgi:uncharacterized membrane protein